MDFKTSIQRSLNDMKDSLWLDPKKEPDFFWVFVGRTLYYLSLSCQSFLFYYVRDVIGI